MKKKLLPVLIFMMILTGTAIIGFEFAREIYFSPTSLSLVIHHQRIVLKHGNRI